MTSVPFNAYAAFNGNDTRQLFHFMSSLPAIEEGCLRVAGWSETPAGEVD